eukprot:504501-Pyramimonas_sp.AAC.1
MPSWAHGPWTDGASKGHRGSLFASRPPRWGSSRWGQRIASHRRCIGETTHSTWGLIFSAPTSPMHWRRGAILRRHLLGPYLLLPVSQSGDDAEPDRMGSYQ